MNRRQLLTGALGSLALKAMPETLSSNAFAANSDQGGEMSKTTQRVIACNGIHINIAEQGEGPLVLLVHGFPESWYSWRHAGVRRVEQVQRHNPPVTQAWIWEHLEQQRQQPVIP